MITICRVYHTLTDGSQVVNLQVHSSRDSTFIILPAVTETEAQVMAEKIADAIRQHSTEDVRVV